MTGEAITQLEKAETLIPDDPTIKDHLGDAYYKKGSIEKAKAYWQKSLEIDPSQKQLKEKLEKIKK